MQERSWRWPGWARGGIWLAGRSRTPRWAWSGLAALSVPVAWYALREDLAGFAEESGGSFSEVLYLAIAVGAVAGLVALSWVGRLPYGRPVRWVALCIALGLGLANYDILPSDQYRGLHLLVAGAAVILASSAWARAPRPGWWSHLPRGLVYVGAVWAAFALLIPPPQTARLLQLRTSGSVVAPFIPQATALAEGTALAPESWRPWLVSRTDLPPIAAQPVRDLPRNPIVIYWSIDSLRADVLSSGKYDNRFPTLVELRDSCVNFETARTPGAQTIVTLTSVFSGKYYSSLYWSKLAGRRWFWPHADTTRHFPELLTEAGVTTTLLDTASWIRAETGIARGFEHEIHIKPPRSKYTPVGRVVPELIKRFEAVGDGPAFFFVHLLDAHINMRLKGRKKKPFERYLINLANTDKHLRLVLDALDRFGLRDRTVLMVSSDHGEAFGEHGSHHHSRTLYDELLHVPLYLCGPGTPAHRSEQLVSLLDVGPTILDILASIRRRGSWANHWPRCSLVNR